MELAGRFDQHLVALLDAAMLDAHQRYHTEIVVKPGIDDQSLQRRFDLAFRRGNGLDQRLQHVLNTNTALGRTGDCVSCIDTDDALDLALDPLGLSLRQIDLVENRHDLQALFDRCVAVGYRLRLDTLSGIHHQQCAFAGGQRAADFVVKVNVAGRVDKVELIGFAIFGGVIQRDAVRLDGNTALTLKIHRIQHLSFHLTFAQGTTQLNKAVSQCRLAVVDMGDDGKVANQAQVTHGADHPDRVARHGDDGEESPKQPASLPD